MMSIESHTIDVRGLLCPLPILKLKKLVARLARPCTIELLATDPMVMVDVPVFCAEQGFTIERQGTKASHMYFYIKIS